MVVSRTLRRTVASLYISSCALHGFGINATGENEQVIMRVTFDASLDSTGATLALAQAPEHQDALLPMKFDPLPLGAIHPSGWLLAELQTEANGLAGREHDFYSWVHDSSWTGGSSEYSALNEGFPYWFNGLVPLAYLLDDQRLKEQVHSAAQSVLDRQQDDGWLGPEQGTARTFWARYPFFLGLTNLVDANATWKEPVLGALHSFVGLAHEMLSDDYKGYMYHDGDELSEDNFQWGRVRYQDMLLTLMWLYEKHPQDQSQQLLDCMHFFYKGSLSFQAWYNDAVYLRQNIYDVPDAIASANFPYLHGVNVAQGLKEAAVARRLTHNASLLQTASDGVDWTMKYHGAASGTVLADEREDGLDPFSGSELCTAVETMFSMSYLYQALGDPKYAEYAELATFNAMPVMLTGDWWAHQYMAEPNQPYSTDLSQTPFYNTNSLGQTFGLEPNYPCCAVNHPQGLPKFLQATYVRSGANGLVHTLLSPASVRTRLVGSGGTVSIDCQTKYPFGNILTYTIHSDGPFEFSVRVPTWHTSDSSIALGSDTPQPLEPDSHGLHSISIPGGARELTYRVASTVRTIPRANDTIAVYNGALLYALQIGSTNTSSAPKSYSNKTPYPNGYAPPQSRDYDITNTTAWNYAIDPNTLRFEPGAREGDALHTPIFAEGAPPMSIVATGCLIDWPLYKGSVPGSVPTMADRKCVREARDVRLVPYGCAKLHMAELPTVDLPKT